jgi:DNA (cytosine-5)-methyltransferase 1
MTASVVWLDFIQYIVIDLFCGAGGTTLGYEDAVLEETEALRKYLQRIGTKKSEINFKLSKVVGCVNHDPIAIKSHHANNPDVVHFEEDITVLYGAIRSGILLKSPQFQRLIKLVDLYRAFYPEAKIILWASLECTNFSKAKGGKPRDADSRTLADHLHPYVATLDPDYIKIENVVEFMSWGPLVPKTGRTPDGYEFSFLAVSKNKKTGDIIIGPHLIPESRKRGEDWIRWRKEICKWGYRDEWRELNSADFGALTSRNRLFGCFARPELPIVWPSPTHTKNPEKSQKPMAKWEPVKKALDFSDEGNSVFNRKKPLSTKTMQRLFMGCVKHIAGGKAHFLSKYYSGNPHLKNISIDGPSGTLRTSDSHSLVKACFIDKAYSGKPEDKNSSIEHPAPTITTIPHESLVQAFITKAFSSNSNKSVNAGSSVENPCPTVAAQNRLGVAKACFIQKYNSNRAETGGNNGHSVNEPAPVVAAQPRMALAQAHFISRYNGVNGGKHDNSHGIESPVGALGTGDNHAKVSAQFLALYYSGGGQDGSINKPAGTIPTRDRLAKVQADFFANDRKVKVNCDCGHNWIATHELYLTEKCPGCQSINAGSVTFLNDADYFLDEQFSGSDNHQSINQPAGSILQNDKHSLIKAEKWLMDTNFSNVGSSLEQPAPVITADRHYHYLINPSWGGNPGSIEAPCPVVIARQDKAPLYIITCTEGPVAVPVYEDDCEWTIKLKEFMALYGICDIKMRMLKVSELKIIQGFPPDYILLGNQSDQKKFIGNAVHEIVPRNWSVTMALAEIESKLAA